MSRSLEIIEKCRQAKISSLSNKHIKEGTTIFSAKLDDLFSPDEMYNDNVL